MAFLKRLGICALQSSAPIAAGLLFLMSEVYRVRPNLLTMMTENETLIPHKAYYSDGSKDKMKKKKNDEEDNDNDDNDDNNDSEITSHQLGNFEGSKREPAFAVTSTPALWEASLLRNHFHPSVKSFSASMLDTPHLITFAGDPTTEFSLNAFLNRFAYKNPKKHHSDKIRRPQAVGEEPLNTTSFLKSNLSEVAPDKIFFHKFFGEKEKLRVEGKSRDRSKRRELDDDGGDDDSIGSDEDEINFDEKAIDKFATKLAEDMMRDNDDDIDIDDDYSDSDNDSNDEGNDDDDDDVEDFDMGGSDDEDESSAVDFDEFKAEKMKMKVLKDSKGKSSKKVEVEVDESDDDYELTAFGGSDDEPEEISIDNNDDDDVNSFSDMDDEDEDEDDLSLAFADEMPLKGKKAQKIVVDSKKSKGKGKKPAGDMSDFASADDYENTMDEIVGRYDGSNEKKIINEKNILIESLKRQNFHEEVNPKMTINKYIKSKKLRKS